jgi:ABC-type sugar transport system ATPase subunit
VPALSINNVSKSFGDKAVIADMTIALPEGELLVLLGPSGCGKSTMLRLIAGLEELDAGEIHLGGRRIDQLQPKDRRVAMVFQNYSLYPHMTVEKNLAFPLKVAGIPRQQIKERVIQTARLLGLEERLRDRPGQLSGGQRQRVALGRAIVRKPDLFLLDEPLSNLDAELRQRMRQEIVQLQRELKTTMVYVTHDQTEALTMADRLAVLRDGRLIQVGSPTELYENPQHLFVAEFLGQPRINTVVMNGGAQWRELFGEELRERLQAGSAVRSLTVAIRPEGIRITPEGRFEASVLTSEYLGDHLVVRLDYRGLTLSARVEAGDVPEGNVRFDIDGTRCYIFDAATGQQLSG